MNTNAPKCLFSNVFIGTIDPYRCAKTREDIFHDMGPLKVSRRREKKNPVCGFRPHTGYPLEL